MQRLICDGLREARAAIGRGLGQSPNGPQPVEYGMSGHRPSDVVDTAVFS